MSNLLNSQITNNNNPIPARKLSQEKVSRYIQAPQNVPQYSINEILQEKDEFRRNVSLAQYQQQNRKKSSFLKICAALTAITAYFIIKCK